MRNYLKIYLIKNMIQYKIFSIILIKILLIFLCSSLKPIKVQKVGKLIKFTYPNFNIIDPRSQQQFEIFVQQPNSNVLLSLLKSLSKTQKSIQIINLRDNGIYEMIMLSQSNNFDNKIIIVKQNSQQYLWVRKNIYLNGFEAEQHLYNVQISDKNQITSYYDIWNPIYRLQNTRSINSSLQYKIHSTILNLIHSTMNFQVQSKNNPNNQFKTIQLFLTLNSKSSARALRNQLWELQQQYKIQLIFQLTVRIPITLLFPSSYQKNKEPKINIYKLNIKKSDKKSILQFKNMQEYLISTYQLQNQNRYYILEEGIYYVTRHHILFAKSS